MRENAYSEFYPYLKKIDAACKTFGTFKWDGENESECPEDYDTKVPKAINKIDSTMDKLGHLEWTPGLYIAAKAGS